MLFRLFILLFAIQANAAYQPVTTVSGTVNVANFPAVQTVSGSLTVSGSVQVNNQITGYATSARQDTGNTYLQSIESNTSSFYALTDAQLRASPVPVSSTGTVPISVLSLPIHGVTQSGTWNAPSGTTTVSGTTQLTAGSAVIGSISNTSFTATQGTATNLKTQAEAYQGGVAVSSAAPLWVQVSGTGSAVTVTNSIGIASGTITSITNTVPVSSTGTAGVRILDLSTSGTITTQNLVPTGTATAGSAVLSGDLDGYGAVVVGVSGTYTGGLSIQGTADNVFWHTITGAHAAVNMLTGAQGSGISSASPGLYKVLTSGLRQIRVTGLSAMTGSAIINIRGSIADAGMISLVNQQVNLSQVGGITTNTGNGTASNTLRVAVASDNLPFPTISVPASSTTNVLSTSVSTGLEPVRVVKASAGRLYSVLVNNTKSTSQSIQVHNTTSEPANGVSATTYWVVPAQSTTLMDFGPYGEHFSTGITINNSTTLINKTKGVSDTTFKVYYQ
jgi:hypothetical protein